MVPALRLEFNTLDDFEKFLKVIRNANDTNSVQELAKILKTSSDSLRDAVHNSESGDTNAGRS